MFWRGGVCPYELYFATAGSQQSNTQKRTYMGTLKPKSNRQLYSNTVIGTLAVDRWTVTFGTASRFRGAAVVRWSLTGELSLSCVRLTADG